MFVFLVVITILFVIAPIISSFFSDEPEIWWGTAFFSSVVIVILFACFAIIPSMITYSHVNDTKAIEKQIGVAEERRDHYTEIVTDTLELYPEYEKKIIGDINPEIILSFPQLRTNEVLQEQVKQILAANEQVYDLKNKLISKRQAIESNSNNPWFITEIWWPNS